jgi:hypothetical protein
MKNRERESHDPVNTLIDEEKRLASRAIPEEVLGLNLKKRMDLESGRTVLFLRLRSIVLLAAAGIVLFLFVEIIDLLKKEKHEIRMVSSMAQFLEQSCGLNNLIQMKNEAKLLIPQEPIPADLESLKRIFFVIRERYPQSRLEKSEPGYQLRPPHYDLSQKIEILFHKKVIHSVLYKFAQKEKEEKNG